MNFNDPEQLNARIQQLESDILGIIPQIQQRRKSDPYTAARLAEGAKNAAAELTEMLDLLAGLTQEF